MYNGNQIGDLRVGHGVAQVLSEVLQIDKHLINLKKCI